MVRVGVVGATGYAGAELVRLLVGHPDAELTIITSRQYSGTRLDKIYPAFSGSVDLVCEPYSEEKVSDLADVVFTALPHQLPMELIPGLIRRKKRVIDLSADFRFRDLSTYEAFYQPHAAKELTEQAVYGLSEAYTEQIRKADLIGNPGCYPTSVLLPLVPLIRKRMIDLDSIIADSKSGVSGAGRSLSISSHFCSVNDSFKAYKVGAHRHTPEMQEILGREAGRPVPLCFVPHLVPMTRGMLTTLYLRPVGEFSADDVRSCIGEAYAGRRFVRLCSNDLMPDTLNVRGTNICEIGVRKDKRSERIVVVSVIDNLVKGAAGQAVQNMNIMLGLNEARGLDAVPFPL